MNHRPTTFFQLFILLVCLTLSSIVFADTYTVQSGDTLSNIAQRELGQSARWKEIAELNNLSEPYLLKIGQTVQMPSDYQESIALQDNSSPNQEKESNSIFKNVMILFSFFSVPIGLAIVAILLLNLISLLLWAAGYKLTCNIFKIKSTFLKCFLAAVCLAVIGGLLNAPLLRLDSELANSTLRSVGSIIFIAYVLISILMLRYILKCEWLLALGVYFIGGFFGIMLHALSILIVGSPYWIHLLTH